MKGAAIISFILFNFYAQSQTDSTSNDKEQPITKYFSKLDLDEFEGKKVDSFLLNIPYAFSSICVEVSSNMFFPGVVKVAYPHGIIANLYVDEFKRTNPQGICRKKNIRLAKKEVITAIQIHNEVACLQGCN